MYGRKCTVLGAAFVLFAVSVDCLHAAPLDPLQLIPEHADLFFKIDNPSKVVDVLRHLEPLQELRGFQAVREFYESTNNFRFLQLIGYAEKELGASWPVLLDKLADGGAVVAVKLGPEPAPAALIVQGSDAQLLRKFVRVSTTVIEQELARQETKDRLERGSYRDLETIQIGEKVFATAAGTSLVIANKPEALHLVVDTILDHKKSVADNPTIAQARKLLPPEPLVWGWLNLKTVKGSPKAKELFAQPRNDPFVTVGFGGWLDVARRSDFLCGALSLDGHRLLATVRMPNGREGMAAEVATHIPPEENAGALPLLQPKHLVLSSSSYFDQGKLWECRTKLFNEQQVKAFEDADKKSGLFLLGNPLNKLLTGAGPHHRLVVVHKSNAAPAADGLAILRSIAFGLVIDTRGPEFGKAVETLARGAGLLARSQVKLSVVEEKYHEATILGFRFPKEDKTTANARANSAVVGLLPTPSIAQVGDQVIAASTSELCKELVDLVAKERDGSPVKGSVASNVSRIYSDGGAEILSAFQDQLFTLTVLNQALAPDEARGQVKQFIDWVRRLGNFEQRETYGAHDFRYEIRLDLRKQ